MELETYLTLLSIKNPTLLAETPRARLWRVESQDGPAVLKVFTARGLKVGDTIGTKLLRLWDGDGAVQVIDETDDAILMEWLDGHSLAELIYSAQALFKWLLATTKQPRLMHGDLNYDNIIQSERGWLAIDPKGIIADPCYEFGVVFRNPHNERVRIATPKKLLII